MLRLPALLLVLLLLAGLPAAPVREGPAVVRGADGDDYGFGSNGSSSHNLSGVSSAEIVIPDGHRVTGANVTIRPPAAGPYPSGPALDVGDDGVLEWEFPSSTDAGQFGRQSHFGGGNSVEFVELEAGENHSLDLLLPAAADLTSASVTFGGEVRTARLNAIGFGGEMATINDTILATSRMGIHRFDLVSSTWVPASDITLGLNEPLVDFITVVDGVVHFGHPESTSRYLWNESRFLTPWNGTTRDIEVVNDTLFVAGTGLHSYNRTNGMHLESWFTTEGLGTNESWALHHHNGTLYIGTEIGVSRLHLSNETFAPELNETNGLANPSATNLIEWRDQLLMGQWTLSRFNLSTEGFDNNIELSGPPSGRFAIHNDTLYADSMGDSSGFRRYDLVGESQLSNVVISADPVQNAVAVVTIHDDTILLLNPFGVATYDPAADIVQVFDIPDAPRIANMNRLLVDEDQLVIGSSIGVTILDLHERTFRPILRPGEWITSMVMNETHLFLMASNGVLTIHDRSNGTETFTWDLGSPYDYSLALADSELFVDTPVWIARFDLTTMAYESDWGNSNGIPLSYPELEVHDGILYCYGEPTQLDRFDLTTRTRLPLWLDVNVLPADPIVEVKGVGDRVFLAAFTPGFWGWDAGTGSILVYNTTTDLFETPIDFPGRVFEPHADSLIIAGEQVLTRLNLSTMQLSGNWTPFTTNRSHFLYDIGANSNDLYTMNEDLAMLDPFTGELRSPETRTEIIDLDLIIASSSPHHQGNHDRILSNTSPTWNNSSFETVITEGLASTIGLDPATGLRRLPLTVSSERGGNFTLRSLEITYDLSVVVDFSEVLNDLARDLEPDENGLIRVPVTMTGFGGGLQLQNLNIQLEETAPLEVIEDSDPASVRLGQTSSYLIAAITIGSLLAIVYVAATDNGRRIFFTAAYAPLYSKLAPAKVLEHGLRHQIYTTIQTQPGMYYTELLKHTSLSNGVLAHHLGILEREGYLRSSRERGRRHFYTGPPPPAPPETNPEPEMKKDEIGSWILSRIEQAPGITQKQLAEECGRTWHQLRHAVQTLEREGRIVRHKEGRVMRLEVAMEPEDGHRDPGPQDIAADAVSLIGEFGGISVSELASSLGVTSQRLKYHLDGLRASGKVISRKRGRRLELHLGSSEKN